MDLLVALIPVLVAVVGVILACVLVRVLRENYLRKVTLSDEAIRGLQIELTERSRRASLQPGMEVDLSPFWRKSGIKEPDRRAVIHPLVDEQVFGWYERRSDDAAENFFAGVARIVWNPTRAKVFVSQWVRDKSESSTVIVETMLGPLVLGDFDNSTTYGDRAGRDVHIGDTVGGDKVGGDSTRVSAGGSVIASANEGATDIAGVSIATEADLGEALRQLEYQAAARGEGSELVSALRWAATMATTGQQPEARDQARNQRVLDNAGSWVRAGLGAIVQGVTGALAGNWLVELLKG